MHAQRLAIRGALLCIPLGAPAGFGFDRQAAWENPRQCGKPAGGTRRFSDDCSPGIFARHKKHQLSSMFTVGVITLGYNSEQSR